ncbi:hypothetical protein DPX39_090112200 [Trypanosoma brucei equiperdum]|uniref:Variant surface glycoprotein n=1 Tax=Trypanosoma brucei equiperdum TaxID=630700 RepID=A0A3L6L1M5_9TRYP|nr:hypothetical protein DPX39_090112200 [Trypanosoma brucei equiperdum]
MPSSEPQPLNLKSVRYVGPPDPTKMARASHLQLTFAGSCSHGSAGKTAFATATSGCTGVATGNNPTVVEKGDAAGQKIKKRAMLTCGDAGGNCLPVNENKDKGTHYGEYYADKICRAITAKTDVKGMPTLDGEELAQDAVIQRHAATRLQQFRSLTEPTNSDKNTELVNFLKNACGKGTSGLDKKFKNLADKKRIKVYKDCKVKGVEIESIQTLEEEQDALTGSVKNTLPRLAVGKPKTLKQKTNQSQNQEIRPTGRKKGLTEKLFAAAF